MKKSIEEKIIWGLDDVKAYMQVGRRAAQQIVDMEHCPKLPRQEHGRYRIPKQAFIDWVNAGMQ